MRALCLISVLALAPACGKSGGGADAAADVRLDVGGEVAADAKVDGGSDAPADAAPGDVAAEGAAADGAGEDSGGGDRTPAAGKVVVKVEGVTGAAGKVIVVFAYPPGGNIGHPVAEACIGVNADPFTGSDTLKAPKAMAMTPCDLETDAKIFDAGTYNLAVNVYTPGAMTPEMCATASVVVDGDVSVTAPALGPCP